MAATCHVRSNSFPSRPYPLAAQVDEQLSRLRSSEAASTSSSYVSRQLDGLQDLYDSLDHLLQLRLSQQALAHQQNKRTVEELLDGSLRLLDVCNIAKDALSQTKQSLNEIQSVLRRKRDLSNEVKKYLASRKTLRKSLQKVLKSLKANENKYNHDDALGMLKETEAATASVLESLLCFVSCSGMPQCKGSLITKLMNKKRVACEEEAMPVGNEFARIDAAFNSFIDKKSEKTVKIEDVCSLETCIQGFEEGIECLFRSLIQVRVSVLNIVGQQA